MCLWEEALWWRGQQRVRCRLWAALGPQSDGAVWQLNHQVVLSTTFVPGALR